MAMLPFGLKRWNLGEMTTLVFLTLFLLSQSLRVSASGLLNHGKACGKYHIRHLGDPSHAFFYINGRLVNRYVFCKSLKEYKRGYCFIKKDVRDHYCGSELDASFNNLHLQAERKLVANVAGEVPDRLKNSLSRPQILAIAVPALFILACVLFCPCFQARKRATDHTILSKKPQSMDSVSSLDMNPVFEKFPGSPVCVSPLRVPNSPSRFSMLPKLTRLGSVHMNMSQVARATHNFSPSLLIGEGGFGTVYKAELSDGQIVAVKRARAEHFDALQTEFRSEVELLAKIDHRNLVKLLGYLEQGNERLLITEYVPNGTPREHLDEKQIIHRDIKSSNILLTGGFRAKVADFGFARIGDDIEKAHISTKVKGTVGYIDPEYMMTRDVYSFGILLLEILTGRRPMDLKKTFDERVTIRWAFRKYNEGKFAEMLDPLMKGTTVDKEILLKIFGLVIQCADRPDMKAAGEQLWEIRMENLKSEKR